MLEKNCHFEPLKQKLVRLKRDCDDMGTLMAALVKYTDSDSTKDPESDDEKQGKGKKCSNTKGQQHNPAGHGNNGKRKKRTPVWILWLIPTRRITVSVVRVNRPRGMEDQVSSLSTC